MVLFKRVVNAAGIEIITKAQDFSKKELVFEAGSSVIPITPYDSSVETLHFYKETPFAFEELHELHLQRGEAASLRKMKLEGPQMAFHKYEVVTRSAPTRDGELVPLTVLKPKKLVLNRTAKTLIKSYGCYGECLQPVFDLSVLAALESGFVVVYAHVRGGSEKGEQWHQQALGNKLLSVEDLEATVHYLVSSGISNPARIALEGGSAGAIAIMGLINRKPHLAKCLYLHMPFLSLLETLLNKDLPLSRSDHSEFGDPSEGWQTFQKVQKVCPKEMLRHEEYPAIMIRAGMKDIRCPPSGALSFLARFREVVKQPLKVEVFAEKNIVMSVGDEGHHGATGTEDRMRQSCDALAFMSWALGEGNREVKSDKPED